MLVVATPNSAHAEVALAGIERGLAVVVDKPLAPTAAEARRLLDAGGRLTVFHNRRWDGDFLTVARGWSAAACSASVRFESRFERFRPEVDAEALARARRRRRRAAACCSTSGRTSSTRPCSCSARRASVYGEVRRRRPGARSRTTCSSRSSTRAACARSCG